MTWWGREATPGDVVTVAADGTPILYAGDRRSVADAVRARIAAFTPTWSRRGHDAGEAWVRLFGDQVEAVLGRLARWPDKAVVELLITAGIAQRAATPATAIVTFAVAPDAGRSVLVPAGFQIGAQPAGGGDFVTFETDRDLVATSSAIAALLTEGPGGFTAIPLEPPPPSFPPFGADAEAGRALWIGLDGDAPLGPRLAFGFDVAVAPGAPRPASDGGVASLPLPPGPLLRWHLLDGGALVPVEALFDDTEALAGSGAIELAIPRRWSAGVPPGASAPALRWLRLSIASGRYAAAPALAALHVNAVSASAAVTVRDEVLEPVAPGDRSYRLAQRPVLPGTLILEVDDDDAGGVWREVADLSQFGPEARVFALDAALGIVYVGDGVTGAAIPPGFRNVIARRYRVGGGAAGAVPAEAISTLVGSAPFVTRVTNPRAASGGDDLESVADAIRRGPEELRARGRAVTLADYELLALATPLAAVRRAHALSGHPAYPGARLTGVVGVIVVPADRGDGPPVPDEALLGKVARHLARGDGPLGVEIVAAAPAYHRVSIEARVVLDRAADVGSTVERVLATLDRYLHPLTGGDDGLGWPFGGAVRHGALLRQIVSVAGVRAAPRLELVVDGELAGECADVAIPAHALVWPGAHQVIPVEEGDDP